MYYNKQFIDRDNDNVLTHDQQKRKFSSTIIANNGAHTLTDDKIIRSPSNKKNVVAVKNKQTSNNDLITRACRIGAMVLM